MSKIIIVDDDYSLRDLYAELFRTAGFEVISTGDGQDALQKAEANHPDIIFTGIDMPGLTGFELIDKVRAHKEMNSIPVILFSHLNRDKDKQQARMLPNVQFKVKGYDSPAEILKSARTTLESRSRGFVPPVTQATAAEDDDRPPGITF
jgi:CheY-like chemotaxis protein